MTNDQFSMHLAVLYLLELPPIKQATLSTSTRETVTTSAYKRLRCYFDVLSLARRWQDNW
jgi:hypothetical protein